MVQKKEYDPVDKANFELVGEHGFLGTREVIMLTETLANAKKHARGLLRARKELYSVTIVNIRKDVQVAKAYRPTKSKIAWMK